jgi:hypothetical protein
MLETPEPVRLFPCKAAMEKQFSIGLVAAPE